MTALRLALRQLRRDLRTGELRVLLAALVLAVMAVASVGFLTDRAARALDVEAHRLLGGDAVLRADAPIERRWRERAAELGLAHSEVRSFPSMLQVGETLKLADLRALDAGYPLRGEYRIRTRDDAPAQPTRGGPAPGTLWLSRDGARQLGARIGDAVQVGELSLRLAALVDNEPDAGFDYFNIAPRGFFHLQDLPATGLDQFGSRINYRVVVAGEPAAVKQWTADVRAALVRGQRLETLRDARPEVRSALQRADRFLGLAALTSVVLAGVAVAMAARRHAEHQLDACAVLRCLGAKQGLVLGVQLGELAAVALLGSAIGPALAWAIQAVLGHWLSEVMKIAIPPPGGLPALQALAAGVALLLAFALPPLLALRRVPAVRVLRREIAGGEPSAWFSAALGVAGLIALLGWKAGSLTLGSILLGGLAATLAVLALLGGGLIWGLRRSRARLSGPWRYGLASLGRHPRSTLFQVAALGLGLLVILLLSLTRSDLIERWQRALPADTPNRFIINVQADQVDGVRQRLAEIGIDAPLLYPMVRGRLQAVNDVAVSAETYAAQGDRARRLAEREFNLTWTHTLRERDNKIVAGRFWGEQPPAQTELSVEEELAKRFGWQLGDRIRFDIAGSALEGRITSLRRVDWESFQPNFFVLISPGALAQRPASYITAVHLPKDRPTALDGLVRDYPNLSVIDVEVILRQVRSIVDQVAAAIEYVFYFTVLAGLLVMFAAVSASQDERLLQGAVMRAFGASRRQLRLAQLSEFAALGLIAGVTAALAATVLSGVLAQQVFDLPWQPDWRLAAVGSALGVVLVSLAGLWATRRIVAAPPLVTLRALQD